MDIESNIREWTKQRYEYYVAGRTLWFNNQMQTGALMFAYAIEAHIKHLLSNHRNCPRKLLYSHDIPILFEKSIELDLFTDVEVSDDLLRYAQDNFHRRYPSQTNETIKAASDRGHALFMDPGLVIAYDDLILQMDYSIYKKFGTPKASVAAMAAQLVDCADGRFFFHSNHAALDHLNEILKMHEESLALLLKEEDEAIHEINRRSFKERLATLSNKEILVAIDGLMRVSPGHQQTTFKSFAKNFTYPGRYYERTDGTKVWSST